MHTRHAVVRIAKYLLAAFVLQAVVASLLAVPHGEKSAKTKYVHNPRAGDDPIAMILDSRFGLTYAYGMDRPGTLVDRNPEWVHNYQGKVWWPREAVTMFGGTCDFAIAAGWPYRSMTAWCGTFCVDIPPDDFEMHWRARNGILLSHSRQRREEFPVCVVPLKPLWNGTIVNTLVYAVTLAIVLDGVRWCVAKSRRSRGLCAKCAYPLGVTDMCSECGQSMKLRRGSIVPPTRLCLSVESE